MSDNSEPRTRNLSVGEIQNILNDFDQNDEEEAELLEVFQDSDSDYIPDDECSDVGEEELIFQKDEYDSSDDEENDVALNIDRESQYLKGKDGTLWNKQEPGKL